MILLDVVNHSGANHSGLQLKVLNLKVGSLLTQMCMSCRLIMLHDHLLEVGTHPDILFEQNG